MMDNEARVKGGAISYNLKQPTIHDVNFEGNSASYGSDIGSYCIKLEETIDYQMVVESGVELPERIIFHCLDQEN